jgi:phosphoserine phosphatase
MSDIYFDACNTITKTNNTYDFIFYVLIRKRSVRLINFLWLKFIIKILKNIKWTKSEEMYFRGKLSKEYIEKIFAAHLFNEEIIKKIENEKKCNNVKILSASIDPPIAELSKIIGVNNYTSSILEIDGNHYTGKLKIDLYNNKKKYVVSNKQKKYMYTDNAEDLLEDTFDQIYYINGNINTEKIMSINLDDKEYDCDTCAIRKGNYKFCYIPGFYYFLSRIRLMNLAPIIFKEILPLILINIVFLKNSLLYSITVSLLTIIGFFSVYEIGGFFNDLNAIHEDSSTKRISRGIKIDVSLFISIRFIFFLLIFLMLNYLTNSINYYYLFAINITLVLYSLHNIANAKFRIFTFILLKIFRTLTPLLLFNSLIVTLCSFTYLFFLDFPSRLIVYIRKKSKFSIKFKNILLKSFAYTGLGLITAILFSVFLNTILPFIYFLFIELIYIINPNRSIMLKILRY